MRLTEIVTELKMEPSEVRGLLDVLVSKGYLEVSEVKRELHYKTSLGPRRARKVPLDIWKALGAKLE